MVWPRRRRAAAMLPSGGSEAQLTAYAAPSGGSAADSDGSLATSRRTAQDRLLRDPASEGQLRDARRGRFLGTSVPAEQSRVPLEMRACIGRWHASAGGAWERLQARHEGRKLRPQNPRAKSLSSMHRFGRQTRRSGRRGLPGWTSTTSTTSYPCITTRRWARFLPVSSTSTCWGGRRATRGSRHL